MIVPMHKAWQFTLRKPERLYSVETETHRWPVTKAQAANVYLAEDELSCSQVRLLEHDRDGTNVRVLADTERAYHFERGYIVGCIPAGSNTGMLPRPDHYESAQAWCQRLRTETNKEIMACNLMRKVDKPLLPAIIDWP